MFVSFPFPLLHYLLRLLQRKRGEETEGIIITDKLLLLRRRVPFPSMPQFRIGRKYNEWPIFECGKEGLP